MEVLGNPMQRLQFRWQQSPFGQRWITIMFCLMLVLTAMVAHAWYTQQQLQEKLGKLPAAPTSTILPALSVEQKSSLTLQQWPAEDEAERISAEILARADAMGMIFERAEFQSLATEHSALQIQRIKLPLKGDYPQIRQFLKSVLQAYPSLALSQFKLQRSDVLQTGIEAYVEFSLYTRKGERT